MNTKIYQKLLDLYFESDRPNFSDCLYAFWMTYRYHGECESMTDSIESYSGIYIYTTDLYEKCRERELREQGFHLNLPADDIEQYFGSDLSPDRLFAIMFGLWYGLTKEQIQLVAEAPDDTEAWDHLNHALCCSDGQVTDGKYTGNYYVYPIDNCRNKLPAQIVSQDTIVVSSTGQELYIV